VNSTTKENDRAAPGGFPETFGIVERVGARHGQGTASMFSLGSRPA